MLPLTETKDYVEAEPRKKPPSPSSPSPPLKNPALLPSLHPRHRAWICAFIVALQLLILLSASSFRFVARRSASSLSPYSSMATSNASARVLCPLGNIYVYDLPPAFNKELIDDCDRLNPWSSRCDALANHGFGPPAADLAGIVPMELLNSWHSTDQFAAELIYHRRILAHPCRTVNSTQAAAFYIPFYGGLAVGKHLWSPNATADDRDRLCLLLLNWLEKQDMWRRHGGLDHFIVLGRITWDFRRSHDADWGGSFLYMKGMENVTRLLIERNPWDERDVGVPYPTSFHPNSGTDVSTWQSYVLRRNKTTLFSFAGASRRGFKNDFRGILLDCCARVGNDVCRSVDCGGGKCRNSSSAALKLFLSSNFCLQPRGDSFTRRSVFDCMVAGAIPVFFWNRSAYSQYDWFLPPGNEWSVFIDRRGVRNGTIDVAAKLQSITKEKVQLMRERVVELIPRLIYSGNEQGLGDGMEDAFDVALKGVLRRFQRR